MLKKLLVRLFRLRSSAQEQVELGIQIKNLTAYKEALEWLCIQTMGELLEVENPQPVIILP